MSKWKSIDEQDNEDSFDEWTSRDEPSAKNFYEKYGFDERGGPSEDEEEQQENEKPWGKWDRRSW